MKIKLGYSSKNLLYYILIFILLLNIGALKVFNNDLLAGTYKSRYITTVLLLCGYTIINFNKSCYTYYKRAFLVIYSLIFLMFIYSVTIYDQSLFNIIKQNIHVTYYLIILLILRLNNNGKLKKVYIILVIITLFTLFAKAYSWYLINYRGIIIFPKLLYEYGTLWKRNELYRYTSTATGSFCFTLISFDLLVQHGKYTIFRRIVDICFLIFIFLFDFFIYQSRAECIICISTFAVMFLLKKQYKVDKLFLKIVIIVIVAITVLCTGILGKVYSSFAPDALNGGTTRLRFDAFEHYFYYFKKNPILGIGFLDNTNSDLLTIRNGIMGNRYLDDLGVIGFIFQFGLVGVVILIIIYIRMVSIFFLEKNSVFNVLLGGLITLFTMMNIMSACPFDSQRMIVVPFLLAIFESRKYYIKGRVNEIVE